MTRRFIIAIMSMLPLAAGADTFDEILSEVMYNNLTVRSENARAEAQVEGLYGENTLEAPEVEFSRVWNTESGGENKWSLSVSQSFDWPGVYAARREAARTAHSAMHFLRESTLLDLRQETRSLLIDIIHNAQLIEMQSQLAERMDSMEIYYKKAAEAGAETRLDYNKTVLERIATHRELNTLKASRAALLASLQNLNGGMDVTDMVIRLGSTYPIMPAPGILSAETIRERDPQIAAAQASLDAAESMVKVEKRSRIPGFSIGYEHEVEGTETFNGFSIGITLPMWGRKHQIKASKLEAEAALMDAEMALTRRMAEMDADRRQLDALRATIDEYEPVINDKTNYELLQKALKAGQINFLTFIQESNYFIAARRDYIDTLYEYNLTLSRLNRYN